MANGSILLVDDEPKIRQALSQALLEAEESWATPAQKLRSPQEYLWAAYRALNLRQKPGEVTKALTVQAHKFSGKAAEKIAAAGGKAEAIAS